MEDGRQVERGAKFMPIGFGAEDLLAVVAVVEEHDVSPDPASESVDTMGGEKAVDVGAGALHEEIRRFRREAAARYGADQLIGRGPAMQLARRQVELAIAGGGSVLLFGPEGSGRRHVATSIHYGSADGSSAPGTLLPLDCSVLGADLLETVLSAMVREKFADAHGGPGSLLFHRIDELSSDLQVELAGLLTRRPSTWRLMATAADSLVELARRGKFRLDLAAALSTITIELPALAQRRDDLPLLAQLFLEEQNAGGSRQIGGFTPAALDVLDGYGWPGNLDELASVVAEAYLRAKDRTIDAADLPERLRLAGQAAAHPRRVEETIVLEAYLQRVERELIRRAIARAKGNKAKAARLLGTTRPRLYRRMEQLGIE
jgi:DNA-binding NtrC family response regulator